MLRQIKAFCARELLLCLLSAILLALSFSFTQCWILAWFAFLPLFLGARGKNIFQTFVFFYITGLIFWSSAIYWLIHVTLLGQIILIAYLALYFGIFGVLISTSIKQPTFYSLLFIPSAWVLFEYIRSYLFTGFPWALLGYSQYANLPVIQVADIAGAWGVSFLTMMVNAAVYSVSGLRFAAIGKRPRYLLLPILCLIFTLIYGYYQLSRSSLPASRSPLKISVVQGNIPQALKWHSASREFIMERYLGLTDELKASAPDLIIWPEASLPVVAEDEPAYFERLIRYTETMATPLLFGAVTKRDGIYYNSALLLSKEGKLLERYDKLHLVPFGEYIPFRNTFRFLESIVPIGDIAPGEDYTIFYFQPRELTQAGSYKFGVLICFEDIFPELARGFVKRGAEFLVNITNDAWFGKTTEAYQHLAASVFRAVENRVYLVRAANTGVSGFIDPHGRIISLVKNAGEEAIFTAGHATQEIFPQREPTFYGRYGDFFVGVCLLLVILKTLFVTD